MAQKKSAHQPKVQKKKARKKSAAGKAAPRRPKEDLRPHIRRAAMDIAGTSGWDTATLSAIAAQANVSERDVRAHYSDIWAITFDVLDDIEDRTQETVQDYLAGSWRDNLLEILMTRFDFAQEYRPALSRLLPYALRHPRRIKAFTERMYDTLQRMLLLSRIDDDRVTPPAIAAFSLIYLSLVDRWSKDDSADMSPTMAAIDKRLGWFEQALPYIGYIDCPGPAKEAAAKASGKVKSAARKAKAAAKKKLKRETDDNA